MAVPSLEQAPEMSALDPGDDYLQRFSVYETQARFIIFGYNHGRKHWRVLKIDRTEPDELNLTEDPTEYTEAEKRELLARLREGNRPQGGLNLVTHAYGIVGFVKFLWGYYMILVKERDQVGNICGHLVYRIVDTMIVHIPHASCMPTAPSPEQRYRYKLLPLVDLTRDFFFSYTYPVMQCLQRNAVAPADAPKMPYESMFVWNAFLSRKMRETLGNSLWTIAIVHGFFKQTKCSLNGRITVVTLIARRSRHFAGTRYLKRGVNDKGKVANDVETEQIVADDDAAAGMASGQITSSVQNRGSIPLFWSQQATQLTPKPDISVQRYDPVYAATALHFKDLESRYGNPIVILNLIKTVEKKPREMILRRGYKQAIDYLNEILEEDRQLKFIHSDYNQMAKSKSGNVLNFLQEVASTCLDKVGFFYSGKLNADMRRGINRRRRQRMSHHHSRSFISHDLIHVQPIPSARDDTSGPSGPAGGGQGVAPPGDTPAVDVDHPQTPRRLSGLVEFVVSSPHGGPLSPTTSNMSENSEARTNDDAFSHASLSHVPADSQLSVGGRGSALNILSRDYAKYPTFQSGVLRTNCIDCLDRTNVAQYAYGMCALGRQLIALGLADEATVDPDSKVAAMLIDMYTEMGDSLAIQYGGSAAHNTVLSERQGKWTPTAQSHDLLKSIKRYISNVISDKDKQDSMNLFLGHFIPQPGKPSIWELESDYYLHVRSIETKDDTPTTATSSEDLASRLHLPGMHVEDILMSEPGSRIELTSLDDLIKQRCGDLRQVTTYKDDMAGPSSPHEPVIDALMADRGGHSPMWVSACRHMDEAESAISNREVRSDDEDHNIQLLDEDELAAFFGRYLSLEAILGTDDEDESCNYAILEELVPAYSSDVDEYRADLMEMLLSDEIPEYFRRMNTPEDYTDCSDPTCNYAIHIGIPDYACTNGSCGITPPAPLDNPPAQEDQSVDPPRTDEAPSNDYTRYLRSWLNG